MDSSWFQWRTVAARAELRAVRPETVLRHKRSAQFICSRRGLKFPMTSLLDDLHFAQRVGAKLELHHFGLRAFAALRCDGSLDRRSGPQSFAFPIRFGSSDASVHAFGVESPSDRECEGVTNFPSTKRLQRIGKDCRWRTARFFPIRNVVA